VVLSASRGLDTLSHNVSNKHSCLIEAQFEHLLVPNVTRSPKMGRALDRLNEGAPETLIRLWLLNQFGSSRSITRTYTIVTRFGTDTLYGIIPTDTVTEIRSYIIIHAWSYMYWLCAFRVLTLNAEPSLWTTKYCIGQDSRLGPIQAVKSQTNFCGQINWWTISAKFYRWCARA